jgi:hypothetical protein
MITSTDDKTKQNKTTILDLMTAPETKRRRILEEHVPYGLATTIISGGVNNDKYYCRSVVLDYPSKFYIQQ